MILLALIDHQIANVLYETISTKGINVSLIFAFETLVLFSLLVSTFSKYVLHMACSGWTGLRVCVFYINLASDLFKICAYLVFFSLVYSVIGIPLHIVGDVYQTLRSLQKRISDFLRFRSINASINTRFPTVTAEELARAHDNTCIVCQSDMIGGSCKRLPCRHVVHTECIKSWLEEHATCPLCRYNVMAAPLPAPAASQAVHSAPAAFTSAPNAADSSVAHPAEAASNSGSDAASTQPPQPTAASASPRNAAHTAPQASSYASSYTAATPTATSSRLSSDSLYATQPPQSPFSLLLPAASLSRASSGASSNFVSALYVVIFE
jgi:E3 ubiquitin-protein ligase synoviolin